MLMGWGNSAFTKFDEMPCKEFILINNEVGDVISSVHNGKPCGTAIMCGTWHDCATYQLKHGIRATSTIIGFD